jgi:hypothetical protein
MAAIQSAQPPATKYKPMAKGLEATAPFGFNAKEWAFTPNQLFNLTLNNQGLEGSDKGWVYLKDSHLSMQDTAFSVPDGMVARPDPRFKTTNVVVFHGTHALNEQEFNASVSSSVSIDGVGGSISTSVATKSSITQNTKQSTALIAEWKAFYSLDVVTPPRAGRGFRGGAQKVADPLRRQQSGQVQ